MPMGGATTLNLNTNECLKSVAHLGYDSYHNICNGNVINLAWGGIDWLGFGFLATITIGLGILVIKLIKYERNRKRESR